MNNFKCVVFVAVVIPALIGSVLSNGDGGEIETNNLQGGESSTPDPKDCQVAPARPNGHQVIGIVKSVLSGCFHEINSNLAQLSNVKGIEGHRTYFRTLCEDSLILRQCHIEKISKWQRCNNNEDVSQVFDIYIDGVNTLLQKGCLENGENLAILVDGIDRHTAEFKGNNAFVRECIMFASYRRMIISESGSSLPAMLFLINREIQLLEDCLIDNIHGDDTFVAVAKELLEEFVAKMKCIHPENGALVRCKTIEESLIDRTLVCPLSTTGDNTTPISLVADNMAKKCLYPDNLIAPKLSDATSLEDFRIHFNVYCRGQDIVKRCLSEIKMGACMCLNTTQYSTYKLMQGNLMGAFHTGCLEEGKRLANVFYTAKLIKNATDQNDAVETCLEDVKSARSTYNDDPSRIYQNYQELAVLRNCIIEKVNGGIEFVEDVNFVINHLMAMMKCVNPQDGAIVLCDTLISN